MYCACAGCSWHSALAIVNWVCVHLGLQLSTMSAVFRMVQAVLRCGWVNNKHGPECCAGGMRVVYGAGCSWHSVFAVVNRLCVDLSHLGLSSHPGTENMV